MLKRKKREAEEEGGVLYIGSVILCLFTGDSCKNEGSSQAGIYYKIHLLM